MLALLLVIQTVPPAPLPMPSFLTGCWMSREGERWTEECWTSSRGGLMIGSSREGSGDTVRLWEWMRIERDTAGNPTFHASPRGAPPTSFRAVRATATEIEWVNPAHDYPQRIRYRRTTTGIDAEISLADGSQPNRWTYRSLGAPASP